MDGFVFRSTDQPNHLSSDKPAADGQDALRSCIARTSTQQVSLCLSLQKFARLRILVSRHVRAH